MPDDFLANVRHEGEGDQTFNSLDDALASVTEPDKQEKDTPDAPPAENKPESDKPSQGGDNIPDAENIPFHQHPRWIERENELKELRATNAEYAEKLGAIEQKISNAQGSSVPSWFGGDEQAFAQYKADLDAQLSRVKQEAVAEYERKLSAQSEQERQAKEYVNTQLSTLRSQGKQFDDNELMKVVADYRPVTQEGNWDFEKALEILELKKLKDPAKLEARKQIAASTNSSPTGEPAAKTYFTPADFRGKKW